MLNATGTSSITTAHFTDEKGTPSGGLTTGRGFTITWQHGALVDPETGERHAPNGAFLEDVLSACVDRLEFYQSTEFRCRENALAITKLEEALHWMQHRTAERTARGVEGTHTP